MLCRQRLSLILPHAPAHRTRGQRNSRKLRDVGSAARPLACCNGSSCRVPMSVVPHDTLRFSEFRRVYVAEELPSRRKYPPESLILT